MKTNPLRGVRTDEAIPHILDPTTEGGRLFHVRGVYDPAGSLVLAVDADDACDRYRAARPRTLQALAILSVKPLLDAEPTPWHDKPEAIEGRRYGMSVLDAGAVSRIANV